MDPRIFGIRRFGRRWCVTGEVWEEIEVRDFRPAIGAWLPDDR